MSSLKSKLRPTEKQQIFPFHAISGRGMVQKKKKCYNEMNNRDHTFAALPPILWQDIAAAIQKTDSRNTIKLGEITEKCV